MGVLLSRTLDWENAIINRAASWGQHCVTPKLVDRETGEELTVSAVRIESLAL